MIGINSRIGLRINTNYHVPIATYHDTWDRSGRVNRDIFQEWVIQDLMDRGVRYSVIRGSMDERIQQVADIRRGKE